LPILLKISGLARSTFYYHEKMLQVGDKAAELKAQVAAIYTQNKGRYGYRRITAAMRQLGHVINHKAVQRLMKVLGLKSLVRVKRYRSYKGTIGRIAPDLLKRDFAAQAPNQKWVTDVTEFKVGNEKLYLSPVMDLYNGEIIAFETARRPVFTLVSNMLKKAFSRLQSQDAPVLHSDQGWQYQLANYQHLLRERNMIQSMSRKGNCLDNAAMESFFGTLKTEFFYLNSFASVEQLKAELGKYIKYYNHDRIKLKLKGLSPVQYRNQPLRT
jgi:transposase InsO family protein